MKDDKRSGSERRIEQRRGFFCDPNQAAENGHRRHANDRRLRSWGGSQERRTNAVAGSEISVTERAEVTHSVPVAAPAQMPPEPKHEQFCASVIAKLSCTCYLEHRQRQYAIDLRTHAAALAQQESLHRNRLAGLLFSGAIDKVTGAEAQKYAHEYVDWKQRAAALAVEVGELRERLKCQDK